MLLMRSSLHALSKQILICLLAITSPLVSATNAPMTIKYVDRGELDHRNEFIFKLISLILEQTTTEFGEYRIEPYPNDPGVRRLSVLINEGDIVNLLWSSPGSVVSKANVITIPFDILQGLMGQRICLINNNHTDKFSNTNNINSLDDIRIGQGIGWSALQIYSLNNIIATEAPTLEGLFVMLAANRFDCIPLGANEIASIYRERQIKTPSIVIEKNLLIHYDYPTYLYISAKHPEIAQRINSGLQKIRTNGKFKALFDRYYRKDIEELGLSTRHEICLKSPLLPLDQQCLQPQFPKKNKKPHVRSPS